MHRVAVTGLGVAAPNGIGVDAFWATLLAGEAKSAAATQVPEMQTRVAEILDNSWTSDLPVPVAALDRSGLLAVKAAEEALAQARLVEGGAADPVRVGVVLGNGAAGQVTMDRAFRRLYQDKLIRTHPLTVAKSMVSSSASWVSMAYGLRGPTFVVGSACASGTHAIGVAAGLIRAGMADIVVTGGTEAPLCYGTMMAWDAMKIMSPDLCRPFSAGRSGLILAEGAGIIVLEPDVGNATLHRQAVGAIACLSPQPDGDLGHPPQWLNDAHDRGRSKHAAPVHEARCKVRHPDR